MSAAMPYEIPKPQTCPPLEYIQCHTNDWANVNRPSSSSSPQDFNVHRSDCREGRVIEEIAKSQKLGEIASDILGVDSVRLYQTCTFYKAAGQGETSWHADLATAPFDTNNVCSGQSNL
jgi:hypothetical protein